MTHKIVGRLNYLAIDNILHKYNPSLVIHCLAIFPYHNKLVIDIQQTSGNTAIYRFECLAGLSIPEFKLQLIKFIKGIENHV